MIIVLAPSAGGKSTLTRYFRENSSLSIAEIDEELLAANNNEWPSDELIHKNLIPAIMKKMLSSNHDIFFAKDIPEALVKEARLFEARIVVLNFNIEQLVARNQKRMEEEAYDDATPWLSGQIKQLNRIISLRLSDLILDGNLPVEEIALKLTAMCNQHSNKPTMAVDRFLGDKYMVKVWPKKQADKVVVLEYLITKFASNKVYSEKEVNEILNIWHTFQDWPLLRRELVDRGYMTRDINGYEYRKIA